MWDVFKDWIFDIIHFFYDFCGDWGLAIIIVTVIFRILISPLMHKQTKSSFQMQDVYKRQVHGCVGQVLHYLGEQLAGNHGLARLLDERRNRVLDGQLEVGRLKRKGVVVRVEVDARQNGKRRSGCDALEHHGQRVLQFRLVDAEFQDVPFL